MIENIVLLTGMSGAGKTSAMNALEDLGYYCIDNFPKDLLPELERWFSQENQYRDIALSVSAMDYMNFVNFFDNISQHIDIIFLDASDEELLLRYRFTRRLHPMIAANHATTLEDAIEMERDYYHKYLENVQNMIHIDTTKLSASELAKRIRHRFSRHEKREFTVTFQSFGFKHGVPLDSDMVIDVRFLPNPFYEPDLRDKTGNHQEVYDYVINAKETQNYLTRLKSYMDFVFESYDRQDKAHMIVSIGCTGGQHRSVSICNWLYETYHEQYRCFKSHRDIGVEEV